MIHCRNFSYCFQLGLILDYPGEKSFCEEKSVIQKVDIPQKKRIKKRIGDVEYPLVE